MSRRWVLALTAVALVSLACTDPGDQRRPDESPPAPVRGLPSSMVALGDSISAAYGTCLAPTACPRNSWSTGDGPQVESHYRRILAANPAIRDHARNLAQPGSTVDDLVDQVAAASRQKADYVTLLIGGNDACRGEMTPVAAFRDAVDRALAALKRGLPDARLLVVGIPNIYRVWEVGHTNRFAVSVWESGVCPNLLANATSTAPADAARRKAFRDRIVGYNGQLRAACATYGRRCRYDDGAYRFRFDLTMLSAVDFFHPNAAGQATLARETYPGTFTW
jgi:lysophospholipase L1-like esterase